MIDRLSEKLDFQETLLDQGLDFAQNVDHRPAPFRAPSERHDAEGAFLVAAFDDGDHPFVCPVAADRVEVEFGLLWESRRDHPLAEPSACQDILQLAHSGMGDS